MRIFVTGVNGQLGHDVLNELEKRGHEGIGSDITPAYSGAADGSAAELALDCGALSGPTQSAPLCELELELKEGASEAALAFAVVLAERFSLRLEPSGKFTRASALE